MSEVKTGKCHCESIEFENIRRCNYSLCRKKGALIDLGFELETQEVLLLDIA